MLSIEIVTGLGSFMFLRLTNLYHKTTLTRHEYSCLANYHLYLVVIPQ